MSLSSKHTRIKISLAHTHTMERGDLRFVYWAEKTTTTARIEMNNNIDSYLRLRKGVMWLADSHRVHDVSHEQVVDAVAVVERSVYKHRHTRRSWVGGVGGTATYTLQSFRHWNCDLCLFVSRAHKLCAMSTYILNDAHPQWKSDFVGLSYRIKYKRDI